MILLIFPGIALGQRDSSPGTFFEQDFMSRDGYGAQVDGTQAVVESLSQLQRKRSPRKFFDSSFFEEEQKRDKSDALAGETLSGDDTPRPPRASALFENFFENRATIAEPAKSEFDLFSETSKEPSQVESYQEEPKEGSLLSKPGKPVLSVSAIVSSTDFKRFKSQLESMISVCETYDIPLGDLYVVGIFDVRDAELQQLLLQFTICRGDVKLVKHVPKKYPVLRSPSWIIETGAGEILLEGVERISEYIDNQGSFIETRVRYFEQSRNTT